MYERGPTGKTTLLRYLLENSKEKIACIVNDVAAINIDAKLVRFGCLAEWRLTGSAAAAWQCGGCLADWLGFAAGDRRELDLLESPG